MPTFHVVYRAPGSETPVSENVRGPAPDAVRRELQRRGCSVLLLSEQKLSRWGRLLAWASKGDLFNIRFGVTFAELSLLCEIFKTLSSTKLSDLQIVGLTIDETPNPWLRRMLAVVRERVDAGSPLSDAMEDPRCRRSFPPPGGPAFPPLMVETIRTGEKTGRRVEAFDRLARTFKRLAETSRSIRTAMVYPGITLAVFFGVCTYLSYMIPGKLVEFFGEKDTMTLMPKFPWQIRQMFMLREHPHYILLPIAFVALIVLLCILGMRFDGSRYALTWLRRRIPKIGPLLRSFSLVRFIEIFITNVEAGLSDLESLRLLRRSVADAEVESSLDRIWKKVDAGASVADAMDADSERKVFPGLLRQMLRVGQASGDVPGTLRPILAHYDEESKAALQRLLDSIPLYMICLIGLGIGPIIYGVYATIGVFQDAIGKGMGLN